MNKKTNDIEKGKKKVLYVVIAIFSFTILSQMISVVAGNHNSVDVVRLILTLVLLYFLYKGHYWARIITSFLFFLAALFSLAVIYYIPDTVVRIVTFIYFIFSIGIAFVLESQADIEAYFNQHKK